jgi:hypothetical protein
VRIGADGRFEPRIEQVGARAASQFGGLLAAGHVQQMRRGGCAEATDDHVGLQIAQPRALLHDPEVLFLDEPTSGLDPAATRDVIDLIGSLATEHGRTVVLATHFLGEAGRLADRMAVLHRGRLHAFGRPHDIAADLWQGTDAELDLGAPVDDATADVLREIRGVSMVVPSLTGAVVRVAERTIVAQLVQLLVERGLSVYGASAKAPTLEDVYFAVEARIAASEGRAAVASNLPVLSVPRAEEMAS